MISRLPDPHLNPIDCLEDVDAGEYTVRGAVKIETGADNLDWLNKGIFISVGGRQRAGVIYEVYLVG